MEEGRSAEGAGNGVSKHAAYAWKAKYGGLVLRETYSRSAIHRSWHEAYRKNPSQLAFDNEIYDWLFQLLKPAGAWVDAGCGSGERSVMLARRCPAVIAVDMSPYVQEAAKELVAREGLAKKVEFVCSPLEELAGIDAPNVHCRGVLMHIPDWRTALANLCRIVQPGGYLVLFEADRRSLEALAVRIGHRLSQRASKLVAADGGLEFWSESNGSPFLVRMADLTRVAHYVVSQGLDLVSRRPMQLVDANRVPVGWRQRVLWLNRAWFRFRLPYSSGKILVARRRTS